ncbi:MAG: hypothetical protein AAB407_03350 [Patescibacteria group bacterium]
MQYSIKYILGVIAILGVVILGIVFIVLNTSDSASSHARAVARAVNEARDNANAIFTDTQIPHGVATIDYAKLQEPGFVVIYAGDDTNFLTLLGVSSFLSAGEHYDILITMNEKLQNGNQYNAVLFKDNSDEAFREGALDTIVMNEDNAPVQSLFTISSNVDPGIKAKIK